MYWLQLFDWYAASISVILICLVEVFIVGWTYGLNNFVKDLEFMISHKIHWWWKVSWKVTTPIILTVNTKTNNCVRLQFLLQFILITTIAFNRTINYHGIPYPDWAITLGWFSCSASIVCIPLYMGYKLLYFTEGDFIDVTEKTFNIYMRFVFINKLLEI